MNKRWRLAWLLAGALTLGSGSNVWAADRLTEVFAKMDAAAQHFTGVTAQIHYTKVTVVVNDKSTQIGGIKLARDKKGYKVLIDFREPEEQEVRFMNGKAELYKPKIQRIEEIDVDKEYKDLMNQFLLLGFGGAVADMRKGYDVTFEGDAKIGGANTVKLNLKPKGAAANKTFVELWISQDNWLPVQQRFTDTSSKDYTEILYQAVEERQLKDGDFALHIRGNGKVERVHPH
jgi:hypothetical protein